jgi:hypothetical protein
LVGLVGLVGSVGLHSCVGQLNRCWCWPFFPTNSATQLFFSIRTI